MSFNSSTAPDSVGLNAQIAIFSVQAKYTACCGSACHPPEGVLGTARRPRQEVLAARSGCPDGPPLHKAPPPAALPCCSASTSTAPADRTHSATPDPHHLTATLPHSDRRRACHLAGGEPGACGHWWARLSAPVSPSAAAGRIRSQAGGPPRPIRTSQRIDGRPGRPATLHAAQTAGPTQPAPRAG